MYTHEIISTQSNINSIGLEAVVSPQQPVQHGGTAKTVNSFLYSKRQDPNHLAHPRRLHHLHNETPIIYFLHQPSYITYAPHTYIHTYLINRLS